MTNLKDLNPHALYLIVGYEKDYSRRSLNELQVEVNDFFQLYIEKGNKVPPYQKTNIAEARLCALAFLEDDRGYDLFRENDGDLYWPKHEEE